MSSQRQRDGDMSPVLTSTPSRVYGLNVSVVTLFVPDENLYVCFHGGVCVCFFYFYTSMCPHKDR